MHCVGYSIFYDAFLKKQAWRSDEKKTRLLEWKGRLDRCTYTSGGHQGPERTSSTPMSPSNRKSWDGIFSRVFDCDDDRHAARLIRAVAHGEKICTAYSEKEMTQYSDLKLICGRSLGIWVSFESLAFWIWLSVLLAIYSVEETEEC